MGRRNAKQLLSFISGYECLEPPQSIEQIKGDIQLAGLMTVINKHLSKQPLPKILDLGCGNGVLLAKLYDIGIFKKYPKLEYIGFDFSERLPSAFETTAKLGLLSHARFFPWDDQWTKQIQDPCLIVIRNVFHELDISFASNLIHEVCSYLPENSVVLFQDITTLPIAEKGRSGWFGYHIEKIFNAGGIDTIFTPDISKKGVDIFLIEGAYATNCRKTKEDIETLLIKTRKEQLKTLQLKYEQLKEDEDNVLPILRLQHDITAISLQLKKLKKS